MPRSAKKIDVPADKFLKMVHSLCAEADFSSPEKAILIIDDEEPVITFLELALKAFFSISIYAAASGNEARQLWKERNGDFLAILCDIRLGSETGMELVSELTRENPKVPVVFMTGHMYSANDVVYSGKPAQLLLKPFNLADLRSAFSMLPPNPDADTCASL